jgi:hypothetical protein
VTQALDRVRQALLHHVNPDTLRTAFYALKRKAAPGADRKSRRDRVRAKLKEIKEELRRRMHGPVREQAEWLKQAVAGFFQYHAVPTNGRALAAFRYHVIDHWRRTLRRRGQKHPMTWARIGKLADDWLPKPRILHPLAKPALRRQTPKVGAVCGKAARTVLCGGRSVMSVPTAIHNPRVAICAKTALVSVCGIGEPRG